MRCTACHGFDCRSCAWRRLITESVHCNGALHHPRAVDRRFQARSHMQSSGGFWPSCWSIHAWIVGFLEISAENADKKIFSAMLIILICCDPSTYFCCWFCHVGWIIVSRWVYRTKTVGVWVTDQLYSLIMLLVLCFHLWQRERSVTMNLRNYWLLYYSLRLRHYPVAGPQKGCCHRSKSLKKLALLIGLAVGLGFLALTVVGLRTLAITT